MKCLLSPEGYKVPSVKMIRFSNVFLFMLSVDAYRSPRIDMLSVAWFGRLKWCEMLLSGSFSCFSSKCVIFLTFLKCSTNLLFICLFTFFQIPIDFLKYKYRD